MHTDDDPSPLESTVEESSIRNTSGRKHISQQIKELPREELELVLLRSIDQAMHIDAELLELKAELDACKHHLAAKRSFLHRLLRAVARLVREIGR